MIAEKAIPSLVIPPDRFTPISTTIFEFSIQLPVLFLFPVLAWKTAQT
jgi:hypothetical protein